MKDILQWEMTCLCMLARAHKNKRVILFFRENILNKMSKNSKQVALAMIDPNMKFSPKIIETARELISRAVSVEKNSINKRNSLK